MLAGDDFDAVFTQAGVFGAGSYGGPVVPAVFTFFVGAFLLTELILIV